MCVWCLCDFRAPFPLQTRARACPTNISFFLPTCKAPRNERCCPMWTTMLTDRYYSSATLEQSGALRDTCLLDQLIVARCASLVTLLVVVPVLIRVLTNSHGWAQNKHLPLTLSSSSSAMRSSEGFHLFVRAAYL